MYLNCFSKLFGLDLEVGEPGMEEKLTPAPMGQLKVTRILCLVVEVFLRAQLAWGETWMINDMFLMGRLFFSPMIYEWRRKISDFDRIVESSVRSENNRLRSNLFFIFSISYFSWKRGFRDEDLDKEKSNSTLNRCRLQESASFCFILVWGK